MKKTYSGPLLQRLGWTGACLLSLPLLVPTGRASENDVLKQLFSQAEYWHDRDHPEDAKNALKKVLSVEPDNSEALYLMALYALQQGNKDESAQWKEKLQAVSPGSARLAELEGESTTLKIAPAKLEEARQLARSGNAAAAVAAYEALFKGAEPAAPLVSEYYQTLAAVPARRSEAVAALSARHQRMPDDVPTALALGKILTYQEASRREGIALLTHIDTGLPEASKSLRQALLWLHPTASDRSLYDLWQQEHPDDTEVAQHFSDNVAGTLVSDGYRTAESGRLADAGATFDQALEADPNNGSALGGLGIIAMRKGDFSRAANYFNRAAALKNEDSPKWAGMAQQAQLYLSLDEAKALANQGEWDKALSASEPLLSSEGDDKLAVQLFRADVLRRKGDLGAAEQAYRALSGTDARKGLYLVLRAEKKQDEARQVLQSLPTAEQRQVAVREPVSVDPLRRSAQRALEAGDRAQAERLLRQALAQQPANVWVRLGLARLLKQQGEAEQAQQILAPALQGHDSNGQYANALYQAENGQWRAARVSLDRIPRSRWNESITSLNQRITFNLNISEAEVRLDAGDSAGAAALLLPLSQQDFRSPSDAGRLASSLYRAGQTEQAVGVVHRNMRRGVNGGIGDYAAQMEVLTKAGLSQEAEAWAARPALLAKSSPAALSRIQIGAVIREADELREKGQYSQAWDKLMTKLHEDPDNPELMLAMARVYQSGKMFKESRRIYQYLLSRNSQDSDARTGAINLALAEGDSDRAASLLDDLADRNTPENLLLAARVARSSGEPRRAMALLRSAKSQLQGLGDRATIGGQPVADNPFVDETPVSEAFSAQSALPWQKDTATSQAKVAGGRARTLADVSKLLNETREKIASWAQTTLGLRNRDGESGLSSLTETKAELGFSMVPFQESRLKFAVTPVMLNAGSTSGDANNRFGTGALQQARGAWKATQSSLQAAGESAAAADAARKALAEKSANRIAACQDPTSSACGLATKEETEAQDAYNLAQQQVVQPQHYGPDDFTAGSSGAQRSSGAELSLSLSGDAYQLDAGTTPLGQGKNRLVGGLRWSPEIAGNTRLTVNAERRAVTDSLLSYVGTKDKFSGKRWGGVAKTGGGLSLSYDDGQAGAYGGMTYYRYQGENVVSNSAVSGNAGLYFRPLVESDRELKVGVNADYMNFKENLSNFSFGQGGYFSPQDYISLTLPVSYSRKADNWDYRLSGAVGYQSYSQKQSDYFPGNADWQHELDWLVAEGYGQESRYAAKNSNGISYNVKLQGNYRLNPQMSVGGGIGYDTVGEYSEASAQLYFRYLLDDQ